MADLIKKIRTDKGDLQIDYSALANKPTISSLGGVAKGGDTMTGNLLFQSSGSVPTVTMQSLENDNGQAAIARISKNASGTVDYGLRLRDYTYGGVDSNNSVALGVSNANSLAEKVQIIHQVDDQNYYYNLYGEHNKPTASDIGAAAASHGTHVTFATAMPKAAGTAAVGTATSVSRGDHVHPAQTTITGNAGSATKLETARTIRTNLGSTDAKSFDGTSNIDPGITGTLQISHGGTGSTTAADARTALGAVAKSGDTMTGNLIINTGASSAIVLQAPDNSADKQSYSRIYKNASATTDYGLQLRDYAHGGDEAKTSCTLMICSSQGTLAEKIQLMNQVNGETTHYTLYGEHNKPTPSDIGAAASNHKHSGGYFRSNVSTLSLTADTITGIALATMYSNDSGNFSLSNGGIKCAKAGYVIVSGSVYMMNESDETARMGAYIYKNTTEIMSQYLPYGGSCTVSAGTRVINVAAGDIIYLKARCSVDTTAKPSDDGTMLSIAYL